MRSIKFEISPNGHSGWAYAVRLTASYLSGARKADELLGKLPADLPQTTRASSQSLFLGALRHGHRIQQALQPLLRKAPRPMVQAVLLVAGYECISEARERQPKIVHHAVEQAKPLVQQSELGLLNAVLRKLGPALRATPSDDWPAFYSHPAWLVRHWLDTFGADDTQQLLEWNQQIPQTYLKTYGTPCRA